jgi:hypothetical protein
VKRFFLSYANAPLKDDPQHFQKILEQIDYAHLSEQEENREDIAVDKEEINKIIEYIIACSNITDPQTFLSHVKKTWLC